ncbi:MAG: pseudouridylate synthase [Bacteroidales bacterium]|nr:pseudouridylate synthase [Bacteroidales bacterium]
MTEKSIFAFIPQRPPISMVDEILYCDKQKTITRFEITSDNIFVVQGKFLACGLIENIAQSAAARIGYLNQNQPVKLGVIGGVKNFEMIQTPSSGDVLTTEIYLQTEIENAIVVSAIVKCEETMIAQAEMKVFTLNNAL